MNKYFYRQVANYTRDLDPSRPITAAIAVGSQDDKAVSITITLMGELFNKYFPNCFQAKYLDVISFNRYNGWYSNSGRLDMITKRIIDEATTWHKKHNKPVIMSEYGADTVEGLHLVNIGQLTMLKY